MVFITLLFYAIQQRWSVGWVLLLGAISFVFAESGRRYTEEDLRLAEDLERRCATAVGADPAQLRRSRSRGSRRRQQGEDSRRGQQARAAGEDRR